jgi:hypothetical protein
VRGKINVTQGEYLELQKLAKIVNNINETVGLRRIAKAEYEAVLRLAKDRPCTAEGC